MTEGKREILILVEGEKTDVRLMEHLLHMYGIDNRHTIVSYHTNIYVLYQQMFAGGDPASMDLLDLLREREPDPVKKELFNKRYSDILLIFDLDPQDPMFSPEKIKEMADYFVESSDMGKLYLNYPMVEAFYHMGAIPDPDYEQRTASLDELKAGTYKQRVYVKNRNHDYTKFATDKQECTTVIAQNMKKVWHMLGTQQSDAYPPQTAEILERQLSYLQEQNWIHVLCTCAFYIADYNPELLRVHDGTPSI